MKPRHTPGPWKYSVKSNVPMIEVKSEIIPEGWSERPLIAWICSSEQDARLIAAAPELLEALKRLSQVAGNWNEDSLAASLDQAYEAITKAEKGE